MVVLILMLLLIQMLQLTKTQKKRAKHKELRSTITTCPKIREWSISGLNQPKRKRRSKKRLKTEEKWHSGSKRSKKRR